MPPARDPSATIASSCLAFRLRKINRAVTALYDEALRPHGLKASQLNLLVATDRLGEAPLKRLGELLVLERSTLSRNVERLVARGWLEPHREGAGQRTRAVSTTAAGRQLLADVLPAWKQAQARARALVGPDVSQALADLAGRLSG